MAWKCGTTPFPPLERWGRVARNMILSLVSKFEIRITIFPNSFFSKSSDNLLLNCLRDDGNWTSARIEIL